MIELELGLIQTKMAQKPILRAEVYAHAMRASQNRKKEVRNAEIFGKWQIYEVKFKHKIERVANIGFSLLQLVASHVFAPLSSV